MKTYVAVTDQRWYEFLAARPQLREANFWMPGGGPKAFGAVQPGEAFLFKTHHPHNRIVGGGFLADYRRLPLGTAWRELGEANGVGSEEAMRELIGRYRKVPLDSHEDPVIGCAMLRDTVFFRSSTDLRPTREEFPGNVVQGKSFVLGERSGSVVEEAFWRLLADAPGGMTEAELSFFDEGPTRGRPRLVTPRLGQRSFAAVVQGAYGHCAVTGNKVLPTLQAAHILPVAEHGQHRIDNGLLLRADVHIMFDRGYLGVHPETKALQVSPRLRETFGNGEEFYARAGTSIALPARVADHPNGAFLEWHLDAVFQR